MTAKRLVHGLVAALLVAVVAVGGWYLLLGRGQELRTELGLVLVGERDRGGMDALFTGPLTITEGGCVGGGDATVIWPHGTEVVDEDPLVLRVPGNGLVRLGEKVEVGGGFVFEPSSDGGPRELEVGGVTVPERCTTGGVFLAD